MKIMIKTFFGGESNLPLRVKHYILVVEIFADFVFKIL